MGDVCTRGLIRRRLLPDVCNYYVSRNALVSVAWRWLLVTCRGLCFTFFPSNVCGVAILRKLNTETRVFRTKLDTVTFILKPLSRNRCWWTCCPEDIINPVSWRGLLVACRGQPLTFFPSNFRVLAELRKYILNRAYIALRLVNLRLYNFININKFVSDAQSQLIRGARLKYNRFRMDFCTIQQANGNVSLVVCLFKSGKNKAAKREE